LQLAECLQEISVVVLEKRGGVSKKGSIHLSQWSNGQIMPRPFDLLVSEFHPALEVLAVTRLQQHIVQHFCQRRGDGECESAAYSVFCQSPQNRDERKVAFG
jgi:hypothetical protein